MDQKIEQLKFCIILELRKVLKANVKYQTNIKGYTNWNHDTTRNAIVKLEMNVKLIIFFSITESCLILTSPFFNKKFLIFTKKNNYYATPKILFTQELNHFNQQSESLVLVA